VSHAPLPPPPAPRSLYVHVPFCRRHCPYCDFYHVEPTRESIDRYLETLAREAARRLPPTHRFETVYVGGGTPTELPPAALERLLSLATRWAAAGAEVTVEANPGTCEGPVLPLLQAAGVTRLSLGAQSLEPGLLRRLGRRHTPREVRTTVEAARAVGLPAVSLDLIWAIPGETLADLERELGSLLDLQPDHVSAYCLTYEPGTPLGDSPPADRLDDEAEAAQFHLVRTCLSAGGLLPYEVSSFAAPGRQCRHNLLTWEYARYHGLGPAASSFVAWRRTMAVPDLAAWLASDGRAVAVDETIDVTAAVNEVLMLGLRLEVGVSRAEIRERTGQALTGSQEEAATRLTRRGYLLDDGDRLRLTDTGRLLANQVILALFSD
jgi:oxygen-independent coproporphyrinogen-3 oxidase